MEFGVKIGTENFDTSKVSSKISFDLGLKTNEKFSVLNDVGIEGPSVSFIFHGVKNQDSLKENLENTSSTMKEILLDLGEDFKDAVNQIEFNVKQKDDVCALEVNLGEC